MNESGLMTAIRNRLLAQTWTGSSNLVFPANCVRVVTSVPASIEAALSTGRLPFCLIAPASAESDPLHDEEPDWIKFNVDVAIIQMVGDQIGENVLIGANKSGGSTRSEGRGILEIEQEVYNAIGKLNPLESVTLQFRQRAEEGAVFNPPSSFVAWRVLRFEGWGTAT